METSTKDSFKMAIDKDREPILGQTRATTRANGWPTK